MKVLQETVKRLREGAVSSPYVDALMSGVKKYGVQPHDRPKAKEAQRIARTLDQLISDYNGVSSDDDWANPGRKDEIRNTWKSLQPLFQSLLGYDPPSVSWL